MNNKIFGYIRVSTKEQNIDRQIQALNKYCKDNNIEIDERDIYVDKASGKNFNREQYKALKINLREGDTIIVKELDRLGRNMEQIKQEWQEIIKSGVNIIVIDTPILNTTNKTSLEKNLISNIVFELLSYMAEKERLKIRQRQAEGIAALRERNGGKGIGRPQLNIATLTENQKDILKKNYDKWTNKEITAVQFMDMLDLKKNSFYKIVKEFKEKLN